jgi:general secretion pathway protein I
VTRRKAFARLPRRDRGFTLLELLLAFVVFTLSFATVLEIMSGSMRNTVRARQYTEAALTAQSVMNQVGLDIPLEAGSSASGEYGEFEWDLSIFDFEATEENFRTVELAELTGMELLQIELEIRWGQPPRERSERFTTVRAIIPGRGLR